MSENAPQKIAVSPGIVGMILINERDEIVSGDAYALQLLGYTATEIRGMSMAALMPGLLSGSHVSLTSRPESDAAPSFVNDVTVIKKDGTGFRADVWLNMLENDSIVILLNESKNLKAASELSSGLTPEIVVSAHEAGIRRSLGLPGQLWPAGDNYMEYSAADVVNRQARIDTGYEHALNESCIVAVTDAHGIIQHVNEYFCKISKYSKAELIGQDHSMVNSGYHSKEFMRTLWVTISGGRIWRGEIRNRAKDGSLYWVDTTIVPFLDQKGKPYKYLAVRYDITEQKNTIEALKVNEERYRNIFENSLVAIYTGEIATMKVCDVNDVGVRLLGYSSKQELLDNYAASLHFPDAAMVEYIRAELRAGATPTLDALQVKRKDGTVFWAKMFIKSDLSRGQAQTMLIDVSSEVHFQSELEKRVNERTMEITESLAREKSLNELKSRFVSFASHEFRTPLTNVLSSASLIKTYIARGEPDNVLRHTDRVITAVDNLTGILNDFLSVEQVESGKLDTDVSTFSLPDFLAAAIADMEGMLDKKKQHVTVLHEGEPEIRQSEKFLRNIMLNLLSNASKYSAAGSDIEVVATASGPKVTIAVTDHGIGIPEEDQPKIFGSYYRAGNVHHIQGTGLGLNIVRKYAELMGGSVSFTSIPGHGTTFVIEFPAQIAG